MNIHSGLYTSQRIQAFITISKDTLTDNKTRSTATTSVISNTADTAVISDAGRSAEAKWQSIANKYDVTNITTNERLAMAQELQSNQLMPDNMMILMVAPLSMNENMNQKSDYLSAIKESLEVNARSGSNNAQLQLERQQLEILEQLHTLANK